MKNCKTQLKCKNKIIDELHDRILYLRICRYYDVRRWGIYEEVETEPITGMDIESAEPEYYNRVIVNIHVCETELLIKR